MPDNPSDTVPTFTPRTDRPPAGEPTLPPTGSEGGTHEQAGAPALLRGPGDRPDVPGYTVTREIACGGMGAVYAAHDPTFDREVAIKVMHFGQNAQRFVVESKVTAQLPHPGVPPVYALGALADGRPFLVMKLIRGRTLADELRAAPRADLPRLLDLFQHVCQTVGFAHSRGIVHRDLKPGNVMVGNFGEALVMDWGLAKSGDRNQGTGDSEDTEPDPPTANRRHVRLDVTTIAGQVKGTPAYMAPEQARGEEIDARADVFALGGILAALLTGKAPFGGTTILDTVRRAAAADLSECFTRLGACGADAELIAVAKRCLAAEAAERFDTGEEVAAALGAYRAGVEERLRRSERERAAAEARAAEELNTRREAEARAEAEQARAEAERARADEQRRRRRAQLVLALVVLVIVAALGAFVVYTDRRAAERKLADERSDIDRRATETRHAAEQEFSARRASEGVAGGLILAADLRKSYRFKEADAALVQAAELAKGTPELARTVEQARRDLALVVQLDDIRYRKWLGVTVPGGKVRYNTRIAPPEYQAALASRDLDLTTLPLPEAARRIAASTVKAELVAAVDDWALYEPDPKLRDRLLEVARLADRDPWRDRLRTPAVRADRSAVAQLVADADPARLAPELLSVLTAVMERNGLNPGPVLEAARVAHPTSFELAVALGRWYGRQSNDGRESGSYEAALALRPDSPFVWNNLGNALRDARRFDEAVRALNKALEQNPDLGAAHYNLGLTLHLKGDLKGAIGAYTRAIASDPKDAEAHSNLGAAQSVLGNRAAAIAACQKAVELDPKLYQAWNNLGLELRAAGDLDAAIAAFQKVTELAPAVPAGHSNLGATLHLKGDLDGAAAAYERAIKLAPNVAQPHYNLATVYLQQQKYAEVIALARTAIRLDPKYANAHAILGAALQLTGDIPGARAALTEAARLDPRHAPRLGLLPPLDVAPPPREVKRP